MRKISLHSITKYLPLFIITLLINGCEVSRVGPEPYSMIPPLLDKTKTFIDLSVIIFSLQPQYWGDAFKNIYYASLTLARLKNMSFILESTENFHFKVWQVSPLIIRRYFYENLYKIRTRFDYAILLNQSDKSIEDAQNFSKQAYEPFMKLIDESKNNIEKHFRKCTLDIHNCPYCSIIGADECLKIKSDFQLREISVKMEELIKNTLPNRIKIETNKHV